MREKCGDRFATSCELHVYKGSLVVVDKLARRTYRIMPCYHLILSLSLRHRSHQSVVHLKPSLRQIPPYLRQGRKGERSQRPKSLAWREQNQSKMMKIAHHALMISETKQI